MTSKSTSCATYGVLGLAIVGAVLLPDSLPRISAMPYPGSDPLMLVGIVRDFHRSHADFDVLPVSGAGHDAGNVAATLPADGRPVYTGGGFRVTAPWRNALGWPIAPHMEGLFDPVGGCYQVPGIAVDGVVDLNNQSFVDSFDSGLGPYGGANVGADALISTNSIAGGSAANQNSSEVHGSVLGGAGGDMGSIYTESPGCLLTGSLGTLPTPVPMPTITAPGDMGPSEGNLVLPAGAAVIGTDRHVDDLVLEDGAMVTIDGDVTILVDGDMTVAGNILVNGTLRLIVMGALDIDGSGAFGNVNFNTGDPARCTVYKLGTGSTDIHGNSALLVARIVAPETTLVVRHSSEIFGTFVGASITLNNNGKFHVDIANSGPMNFAADIAGTPGAPSGGTVSSASSFAQWFRDSLGSNLSTTHSISLARDLSGFYEYSTSSFHPIDDDLFGNEGDAHNNYFTYRIDATFVYEPCVGQMIEFEGDDDAWVFVDDRLVIDLGGIRPGTSQYAAIDRLSLIPGREYSLVFLYAQRQSSSAGFRLKTNIDLVSTAGARTVLGIYD